MEVQTKHWIILTPDGEFMKVPRTNSHAQVGEEICFGEKVAPTRRHRSWIAVASAAVAAMLGMFFMFPSLAPQDAHAETYIYLDVNPSVALGMDENNKVIEVKPLNKSAQKLVAKTDWQKEPVDRVVVDLLKAAKKEGYLQQKDQVILSGAVEEKDSHKTLNSLKSVIKEEAQEEKLELDVHTVTMPKQVQTQAEKSGLSPVKYAAWLIAKKEGKEIPVEEIGEVPVTELVTDIKPVSEILDTTLSEQQWEKMITNDVTAPTSNEEPNGPAVGNEPVHEPVPAPGQQNNPAQNPNSQTENQPTPSDPATPNSPSDPAQNKPGETNTGQQQTGTDSDTGANY